MNADEQFVREQWGQVSVTNFYAGTRVCVEAWNIWLSCGWTSRVGHTASDKKMWGEAAAFTRARLAEIADVKEEIAAIKAFLEDCATVIDYEKNYPHDESANASLRKWTKRKEALDRIFAREQAALAELQRGMVVKET